MKAFRIMYALFQSLVIILFSVLLSIIFYEQVESPFRIILMVIALSIGGYLSYLSFLFMYRKSFVGILTGIYAIPELDNLIPVAGSGVLYLNPLQLISFLTAQEASHHKYSVAIWGDSHGKRLEGRRWIKDINYDHQSKNLHIVFEDSCTLEVLQPKLIYYTDSYV